MVRFVTSSDFCLGVLTRRSGCYRVRTSEPEGTVTRYDAPSLLPRGSEAGEDFGLRVAASGRHRKESQALPNTQVHRRQADQEDRNLACASPSPNSSPHSCLLSSGKVVMPYCQKSQLCKLEDGLWAQREEPSLVDAQVPGDEEDMEVFFFFTTSSSNSSSANSSASTSPLISGTPEEVPAAGTPSPPPSPQNVSLSPTAIASTPWSQSNEGPSSQGEEGPSTSQDVEVPESLLQDVPREKLSDLLNFLLLKYRMKEPITKEEMLNGVLKSYEDQFPAIFSRVSECLELVYDIEVKEVDPAGHAYSLSICLGLTYDGMQSDDQSVPKTGLLINILGLIFMEGNCTSEESMWEALSVLGVCPGSEHSLYGEPRKLITEDWVQENYLEYRQVPNSDPARYEFLWGPRAHTETTKMKVLEYLGKFNITVPGLFPYLYEEALRDEEERAQARIATINGTSVTASTSSRATREASLTPNEV
ncbi:melanoma-associated antigen 8-like [Cynocephalus volans]|uniref:melanoma-associated antigen 8-like n=1 Tax=Cynocephalus volans TaxID=110931 RepID=UPI002FCA56F6